MNKIQSRSRPKLSRILSRFRGNQLAVVGIPRGSLLPSQMQQVAREFNFSETVFLEPPTAPRELYRINIFTPVNEMDFAGHPVIGSGHVLFKILLPGIDVQSARSIVIETKAGLTNLSYDPIANLISAGVPHDLHRHHTEASRQAILGTQPTFARYPEVQHLPRSFPIVSLVKGVTYVLVDLTKQPSLFALVAAGPSPAVQLDDAWNPSFTGAMYYRCLGDHFENNIRTRHLQVRMIAINLEDPACGSGCCTLGAYLTLQEGEKCGNTRFQFSQGSEIGRDSDIFLSLRLDENGTGVEKMVLSGAAAEVSHGEITLPE